MEVKADESDMFLFGCTAACQVALEAAAVTKRSDWRKTVN